MTDGPSFGGELRRLRTSAGLSLADLERAAVVLFWFAAGPSPQPIALYELGRLADTGRPIAVGADPGYVRRADVRVQMALSRPGLVVRSDLAGTVAAAVAGLSL